MVPLAILPQHIDKILAPLAILPQHID